MGFRHLFAAAGAELDPESGRMHVRMCRGGGGVGRGGQKEPRAPIPVPADFPGGRLASGRKARNLPLGSCKWVLEELSNVPAAVGWHGGEEKGHG